MGTRLSLTLTFAVLAFARRLSAAEPAGGGGYLPPYQAPAAASGALMPSAVSYVLSLLFAFTLVILLAYFASKFIGGRFARMGTSGSFFHSVPLDHNKRIVFFELNGSILVLGVTEHSVSLLKEISDAGQVQDVKENLPGSGKSGILHNQSSALLNLENKIKPLLRNLPGGKKGDSDK